MNHFDGCGGNSVQLTSILIDKYGYFATSCDDPINKLYLILANGTYTGINITTAIWPNYIGFDSKGRFIQISNEKITIYN